MSSFAKKIKNVKNTFGDRLLYLALFDLFDKASVFFFIELEDLQFNNKHRAYYLYCCAVNEFHITLASNPSTKVRCCLRVVYSRDLYYRKIINNWHETDLAYTLYLSAAGDNMLSTQKAYC